MGKWNVTVRFSVEATTRKSARLFIGNLKRFLKEIGIVEKGHMKDIIQKGYIDGGNDVKILSKKNGFYPEV